MSETKVDARTYSVDLKWSLWSAAPEIWTSEAPKAYEAMAALFFDMGKAEALTIHTAPRKEIRFGTVVIDPRAKVCRVSFRQEFDEDPADFETDVFALPNNLRAFLEAVDEVELRLLSRNEPDPEQIVLSAEGDADLAD